MNKKAALELGISTVVVLVIAMVIIAGGVAFIRGFFKLGEKKLGGAFDVADFGAKPTSDSPLVLVDGQSVSIKSGTDEKVRIGFYNKASTEKNINIDFGKCISTSDATNNCADKTNPVPIIHSLPQKVQPGESAGFETYVEAKCAGSMSASGGAAAIKLPPAKYVCTMRAVPVDANGAPSQTETLAETQITIEVLS
jgi:hypothetical protein